MQKIQGKVDMNTTIRLAKAATLALAASLPAASAHAGAGDFLVGVGVGAIGKTIYDKATRQPAPPRNVPRASQNREQVRDIQVRLNALGHNAGTADGIMGRKTRAAIYAFQKAQGYTPNGKLTPEQVARLVALTSPDSETNTTTIPVGKSDSGSHSKDQNRAAYTPPTPAIHGLVIGDRASDLDQRITEIGYTDCEQVEGLYRCTEDLENLMDSLTVATVDNTIYLLYRDLAFKTEVARSALESRMADTYPTLMSQNDLSRTEDASCTGALQKPLSVVVAPVSTSPSDPNVLKKVAVACTDYQGIALTGDQIITRAQILLYDNDPINQALEAGTGVFKAANDVPSDLKF